MNKIITWIKKFLDAQKQSYEQSMRIMTTKELFPIVNQITRFSLNVKEYDFLFWQEIKYYYGKIFFYSGRRNYHVENPEIISFFNKYKEVKGLELILLEFILLIISLTTGIDILVEEISKSGCSVCFKKRKWHQKINQPKNLCLKAGDCLLWDAKKQEITFSRKNKPLFAQRNTCEQLFSLTINNFLIHCQDKKIPTEILFDFIKTLLCLINGLSLEIKRNENNYNLFIGKFS